MSDTTRILANTSTVVAGRSWRSGEKYTVDAATADALVPHIAAGVFTVLDGVEDAFAQQPPAAAAPSRLGVAEFVAVPADVDQVQTTAADDAAGDDQTVADPAYGLADPVPAADPGAVTHSTWMDKPAGSSGGLGQ